jgi:hypothetical protein
MNTVSAAAEPAPFHPPVDGPRSLSEVHRTIRVPAAGGPSGMRRMFAYFGPG